MNDALKICALGTMVAVCLLCVQATYNLALEREERRLDIACKDKCFPSLWFTGHHSDGRCLCGDEVIK